MSEGNKPQDIKDRTFAFALDIVRFCQELKSSNLVTRRLCQQLLDSGTSIGANVEEAQAGQSRADFISKLNIALKEARETVYGFVCLMLPALTPIKPAQLFVRKRKKSHESSPPSSSIREEARKGNSDMRKEIKNSKLKSKNSGSTRKNENITTMRAEKMKKAKGKRTPRSPSKGSL